MKLTMEERLVLLYLRTGPASEGCGLYAVLPVMIAAHTGVPVDVVEAALADGLDQFCEFDCETGEVFVFEMLSADIGSSLDPLDNRVIHVKRKLLDTHSEVLKTRFHERYAEEPFWDNAEENSGPTQDGSSVPTSQSNGEKSRGSSVAALQEASRRASSAPPKPTPHQSQPPNPKTPTSLQPARTKGFTKDQRARARAALVERGFAGGRLNGELKGLPRLLRKYSEFDAEEIVLAVEYFDAGWEGDALAKSPIAVLMSDRPTLHRAIGAGRKASDVRREPTEPTRIDVGEGLSGALPGDTVSPGEGKE